MKKYFYKVTFLFMITLLSNFLTAQDQTQDIPGNWLMYFGTNRIADDWSIHSEVQYRNHTVAPVNIEQLLLRTGLNYHISKSATVTLGYGYIPSYDYIDEESELSSTENRIFQQLIMTNKVGRVKFEHRYRYEQRWVKREATDETTYRDRWRYRLMAFIPLNKPTFEQGTLFLGIYDEIFMNTEDTFFDRNRFYVALGYQINKMTQVQAGYLRQRINPWGKNYLQFAVVYNTDFRKAEQ